METFLAFGIFLVGIPYLLYSILMAIRQLITLCQETNRLLWDSSKGAKLQAELQKACGDIPQILERERKSIRRKPVIMDDKTAYDLEQKHVKSRRPTF